MESGSCRLVLKQTKKLQQKGNQKKMKRNFWVIVTMAFSGLLLAGCAGNKAAYSGDIKDETPEVSELQVVEDGSTGGAASPSFTSPPKQVDDERQADSLLKNRIIYFEYDKSVVQREFLPTIDSHADFLLRNADKNLILVSSSQLESLSFGEELPRVIGENEAAWKENRRVELRYTDE